MKNLTEVFEGHYVYDSKTLTENDLAIHVEILNMSDATGEKEFDQYPFVVSFSIVAHTPDASYDESDAEEEFPDRIGLIYDAVSYMGGVPIDHKLQELDNNKILNKLKASEALIKTHKADFGTIAAQYGKGYEFNCPQFKTYAAALKWTKAMLKHVDDLDFDYILDQPVNMMDDSGRNTIEKMRNGK